jgi:PAS domain S-box-containing protein
LRQLAARLTTPVALFDVDGLLIYLNPAAEVLFGVDFARLGVLSLEQALAIARPKDLNGDAVTVDSVRRTVGEGRPHVTTVSIRDPHGRIHHLESTTVPVRGQGGTLFGAMSLIWTLENGCVRNVHGGGRMTS